jgi:cyanophycinase
LKYDKCNNIQVRPLIIVGGADKASQKDIYQTFIQETRDFAGDRAAWIGIVTAASEAPDAAFKKIFDRLSSLTTTPIKHIDLEASEFDGCSGIWFCGGDQNEAVKEIRKHPSLLYYLEAQQTLPLAGTSAGAALMSEDMICGGSSYSALKSFFENDGPELADGLGFFNHGLIDQHFDMRSRLGRLVVLLIQSPRKSTIGFGICENSALYVKDGIARGIGERGVYLVDISDCIIHQKGIEHVRISYLSTGDSVHLRENKLNFGEKTRLMNDEALSNEHPVASGVLSPYADLHSFISRQLLDNGALPEDDQRRKYVESYLFELPDQPAYKLRFYKLKDISELWYKDGYSFCNVEMSIETLGRVKFDS